MNKVTIGEAAKILKRNKRTLMRWDEVGFLPAKREEVSNIRYYDREVIEKVARWFDLRKREKEHLEKLPAINQKRSKFISVVPLDPMVNPKPQNAEEMRQVYKEYNEWKAKYDALQEEYTEFTEGFYGRLEE